jgi:hypothetical protein
MRRPSPPRLGHAVAQRGFRHNLPDFGNYLLLRPIRQIINLDEARTCAYLLMSILISPLLAARLGFCVSRYLVNGSEP